MNRYWQVRQIRVKDLQEGDVARDHIGQWAPFGEDEHTYYGFPFDLVDVQVPDPSDEYVRLALNAWVHALQAPSFGASAAYAQQAASDAIARVHT